VKTSMTVEKAQAMVKRAAAAQERWGRNADIPFTQSELLEALMVLNKEGKFDAPPPEDVTLLRRQLAACTNREKARKGKDNPRFSHEADLPDGEATNATDKTGYPY
jgi:phage-related baseplate assembly protein